jgi:hypothetical protein
VAPPNEQLQRTVTRRRGRGETASYVCDLEGFLRSLGSSASSSASRLERYFRLQAGTFYMDRVTQLTHNKQLQRTVTRRRWRGACASFHCAHTPRFKLQHEAADLPRDAAQAMRCLILSLLLLPSICAAQERIVGLIEIPAIHAAVNEGSVDVATESVTLRTEPSESAAVAVAVEDWHQLESREHGYEQVSAAVYALAYAPRGGPWYKVRYVVGDKTAYGWVTHMAGAQYREVHSLVSSGLAFLTDAWDRRLLERPAADASGRMLVRNGQSDSVRVIEVYYASGQSDPWYLLAVVRGECTGEPLEIVGTGWVPAYTPAGDNTVWFHSRGC